MSDDAYGGIVGAFPYAFRASDSWTFRAYVLVGTAVGTFVTLLFVLALPGWILASAGKSAVVVISRAFLVVVWLLVIVPVVAPVLLVARGHRRGTAVGARHDLLLAVGGFLYLILLYVGVVIFDPRSPAEMDFAGGLAPVLSAVYRLPDALGIVPPALAVVFLAVVARYHR